MRKGSLHPSEKDASVAVPSRDPLIATVEKVGTARVQNKFDILASSEVSKAQEALKSSSVDLQTVVQDPLPDALEIAAGILSNTGQANQKESENNQNQLDVDANTASVEKHIDDNCMGDAGNGKQNAVKCDGKSWPGFMARNRTAHTYEVMHFMILHCGLHSSPFVSFDYLVELELFFLMLIAYEAIQIWNLIIMKINVVFPLVVGQMHFHVLNV